MSGKVWLPAAENIAQIHEELTILFAREEDPISPEGIKDPGLLESAAQRPHTGLGSQRKYKNFWTQLAALFHSVVKNHAFHNGNKRTAIVTLITTLYRNDYYLTFAIGDDEIYDLAIRVSSDTFPSKEKSAKGDELIIILAEWISKNTEHVVDSFPEMRAADFLDRCREAGCSVKESSKGKWFIQNPGVGGMNFGQSATKLPGMVVKRYLQKLGLSVSSAGILQSEFQEGVGGEREQLHRFMAALRRLAKT